MAATPLQSTFVGVDMAWNIEGKHTGIAIMRGDAAAVSLLTVSEGIKGMTKVASFVARHATDDTVVAIDASLIVKNATGQRECETLIGQEFGKYHASCHTTNTQRSFHDTGMRLVSELANHGFQHDFVLSTAKERRGRWVFEVYPHPAMVRLFGLDRIIPYKKGSTSDKRAGLKVLREHLRGLADGSRELVDSPALQDLLGRDLETLRGEALKQYEDTLDAVFCGYLAWHCWRFGDEANQMFGSTETGYIVVPRRPG